MTVYNLKNYMSCNKNLDITDINNEIFIYDPNIVNKCVYLPFKFLLI